MTFWPSGKTLNGKWAKHSHGGGLTLPGLHISRHTILDRSQTPMHGNTSICGKRKVRRLPDILAEIDTFFAIAKAVSVHAGGVHLEMSALDVTECIGGRGPASIDELDKNWLTACDPRLNRAQAIDLAAHVAALIG